MIKLKNIYKTEKVNRDMMNIQGNNNLWYFTCVDFQKGKIIKGQMGTFSLHLYRLYVSNEELQQQ